MMTSREARESVPAFPGGAAPTGPPISLLHATLSLLTPNSPGRLTSP